MSQRSLTVAAAQTGPVVSDDRGVGINSACKLIEKAAINGADIICFSELFLTPFFPNRLERDFERWFMTFPSAESEPLIEAAAKHGIGVVFPFGERNGNHFHNSTALIGRNGDVIGIYRKVHIPAIFPSELAGGTGSYEKFYFSPGDDLPVFDFEGTKVGIQICYDRKFPEGSRTLAMKGAEILFIPICAATYGETKLRGDTWDLPLRARAYENGVFVVAVNRAGDEHGRNHMGHSMIISPIGAEILAEAGGKEQELLVTTIDLNDVAVAQKSLPWWRDRRPELYTNGAAPATGAAAAHVRPAVLEGVAGQT